MKKILITGLPGVGKTTIIKKIAESLIEKGFKIKGFYTSEIRKGDKRVGFKIVDFKGREEIFSHISFKSRYKVGKYKVKVEALEKFLKEMIPYSSDEIIIIDEIGKMECFSKLFKEIVTELLNSKNIFIGTIALKGGGFIEEVKNSHKIKLYHVTKENRDNIPELILKEISK